MMTDDMVGMTAENVLGAVPADGLAPMHKAPSALVEERLGWMKLSSAVGHQQPLLSGGCPCMTDNMEH